jgi:hypothetical protein
MARFVVDLGDVKLSSEQHTAIASAIHGAVLPHLAKLPGVGGGQLMALTMSHGVGIARSAADLAGAADALTKSATA